jgi:hypothetical protein
MIMQGLLRALTAAAAPAGHADPALAILAIGVDPSRRW